MNFSSIPSTSSNAAASTLTQDLADLSLQGAVGGVASNCSENPRTLAAKVSRTMAQSAGSGMEKYCAIREQMLLGSLSIDQFVQDFLQPTLPQARPKKASDYVAILHLWAQSEMNLAHNPSLNLAIHNLAKAHQSYIACAVKEIAHCRDIPEANVPQNPTLDDLKNLWHLPVQTALHNWQLFDLTKEALQPKTMHGTLYDQFDPALTQSEIQYSDFFSHTVPQLQDAILQLTQFSNGTAEQLTAKKEEIAQLIVATCQQARGVIAYEYIKHYIVRAEKLIMNNLEVLFRHLQKNKTHVAVNIPAEIKAITQRHTQIGATCKLSALFTAHSHFYPPGSEQHIPYMKLGDATATTSLRKKAKEHGSVQGEVLSATQFAAIASECGIDAQKQTFNNYEEFRSSMIAALESGHPVAIAYNTTPTAAHCPSGEVNVPFYSTDCFVKQLERYEHATLVTDYDPSTDRFKLVTQTHRAPNPNHPQNELWCHSYQLYLSNLSLTPMRHRETYLKQPTRIRDAGQLGIILDANRILRPIIISNKYTDATNYAAPLEGTTAVTTPTAQNSGFQGCFFACKPLAKTEQSSQ
ncbi:MAG: hypothetical protein ACRCWB_02290 [Enterovibrio sp.]